ncbi:MAG: hypothetical protein JWP71_990 [Mucilaginibacter sp.]|nr:hypothetical protein [Mucilaginibacter sp.]
MSVKLKTESNEFNAKLEDENNKGGIIKSLLRVY